MQHWSGTNTVCNQDWILVSHDFSQLQTPVLLLPGYKATKVSCVLRYLYFVNVVSFAVPNSSEEAWRRTGHYFQKLEVSSWHFCEPYWDLWRQTEWLPAQHNPLGPPSKALWPAASLGVLLLQNALDLEPEAPWKGPGYDPPHRLTIHQWGHDPHFGKPFIRW